MKKAKQLHVKTFMRILRWRKESYSYESHLFHIACIKRRAPLSKRALERAHFAIANFTQQVRHEEAKAKQKKVMQKVKKLRKYKIYPFSLLFFQYVL